MADPTMFRDAFFELMHGTLRELGVTPAVLDPYIATLSDVPALVLDIQGSEHTTRFLHSLADDGCESGVFECVLGAAPVGQEDQTYADLLTLNHAAMNHPQLGYYSLDAETGAIVYGYSFDLATCAPPALAQVVRSALGVASTWDA